MQIVLTGRGPGSVFFRDSQPYGRPDMIRRLTAVCLLAVAALFLGARQEASVIDKIIEEGRHRSEVMAHLDHLVNKIGPRLTSSEQLTRACEWTKSKFEEWGLKNCRLEPWGTWPTGFNRGPRS